MGKLLERLLKGRAPEGGRQKAENEAPEKDATPAGAAVRLEARKENETEHSYPAYRLLVATVLILLAAVLALTGTITVMMPLKTVETKFLQLADAGQQVYFIEPLKGSSYKRVDAVFENIAKTYVLLRHEVVEIPYWMEQRWLSKKDFLRSHSTGKVWNAFQGEAQGLIQEMRSKPYRRSVNIERITREQGDGWRYAVVFDAVDSLGVYQQSTGVKRRFEALVHMRQGNYGSNPNVEFARINPFGIFVVGYHVRELKNP